MGKLTIRSASGTQVVEFEGTPLINEVLHTVGLALNQPCGGRGVCGKCRIEAEGCLSEPDDSEKKLGCRLACRARLLGDACVVLKDGGESVIQTEGDAAVANLKPMEGDYGVAIDIGTTTLAAKLYDLKTGKELAASARLNPQGDTAADVIGRIDAAMKGRQESLMLSVQKALEEMTKQCCEGICSPDEVKSFVITGNTAMLYLLTGRNPVSLSKAPFDADWLADESIKQGERTVYLPPCMNAFVGADITCAVLASGMCKKNETALLCDIGTNGEVALYKDGHLYVTSTAAGPAFEGAGISCGVGSVPGAIDKVYVYDEKIQVHTIAGKTPVGICGSGLIDAVAAFLDLEIIDETGAADDELTLCDEITLEIKDVRSVQLAKAAIAAGIQTLCDSAKVRYDEIGTFYIAGGFGSHLNAVSAVKIGLFPQELQAKVKVIGNGALAGAMQLLLDTEAVNEAKDIAARSSHVSLGGNPKFNQAFVDNMLFPCEDD